MPVIIPALDKTLAVNIQHAAQRYFDAGEQKVVIPGTCPLFLRAVLVEASRRTI